MSNKALKNINLVLEIQKKLTVYMQKIEDLVKNSNIYCKTRRQNIPTARIRMERKRIFLCKYKLLTNINSLCV